MIWWIEECVSTFEELKQYLSHLPVLSRTEKEEVLYAYIVVRDSLFAPRKSSIGHYTCYEEILSLFSGAYCGGTHAAPFTSTITEV